MESNLKYKKIKTEDNSITFKSLEFGETYHSTSGAYEEALKKHIEPSEILNKIENKLIKEEKTNRRQINQEKINCPKIKNEIRIFDFCFGLGYNTLVAIEKIREINKDIKIIVYGVEFDLEIIKLASEEKNIPQKKILQKLTKNLIKENDLTYLYYNQNNIEIKIYIDKAEELKDRQSELKQKENYFDVVFFDAFSPKSCPRLWELDMFQWMNKILKKDAILTTYSCARIVKDNLKNSGFKRFDGPKIGRRAPSTIAIKLGNI
jgi:tRNA U34 5-methylaminomethyl-2-thiouridine-forming methyltransferase MnmC